MFIVTDFDIKINSVMFMSDNEPDLDFYRTAIDCHTIDMINLSDDIVIICDDEGLFKSGNPVFSIINHEKQERKIPGKFMLGKNKITADGIETVGFKNKNEAIKYISDFKIALIGFVK